MKYQEFPYIQVLEKIDATDDAAYVLTDDLPDNAIVMIVATSGGNDSSCIATIGPNDNNVAILSQSGTKFEVHTGGSLSGTTGSDNKLTLSRDTGNLYIENRQGFTAGVSGFLIGAST